MASKMSKIWRATNNILDNQRFQIFMFTTGCVSAYFRSEEVKKHIDELKSEKDSLVKSNETVEKTIWIWRQKLFSEAESAAGNAIVSLSKLQAIYGEGAVTVPVPVVSAAGGAEKRD